MEGKETSTLKYLIRSINNDVEASHLMLHNGLNSIVLDKQTHSLVMRQAESGQCGSACSAQKSN